MYFCHFIFFFFFSKRVPWDHFQQNSQVRHRSGQNSTSWLHSIAIADIPPSIRCTRTSSASPSSYQREYMRKPDSSRCWCLPQAKQEIPEMSGNGIWRFRRLWTWTGRWVGVNVGIVWGQNTKLSVCVCVSVRASKCQNSQTDLREQAQWKQVVTMLLCLF